MKVSNLKYFTLFSTSSLTWSMSPFFTAQARSLIFVCGKVLVSGKNKKNCKLSLAGAEQRCWLERSVVSCRPGQVFTPRTTFN